jgi:uncharacterized damage-inducible protein DinB
MDRVPRVTSRIRCITIDCHDPYVLSRFWVAVLGYEDDPDDPSEPGDPEAMIVDPTGRQARLLFLPVPEAKTVKNRVHLDLEPVGPRDVEVETVIRLGGRVVEDLRDPDGSGWVVLADPEGNELCIVRSYEERYGRPHPGAAQPDRPFGDVRQAGEREGLEKVLDWYRAGVVAKVRGLPDDLARRHLLGSGTTVAGLVKHLALVEDSWCTERFAGLAAPEPWASVRWEDDNDWDFHSAEHDALADLVALYEAACARSRAAYDGHGLDDVAVNGGDRPFTLRFMLLHLVEETARHLGHLDVLRELLDGTTGE